MTRLQGQQFLLTYSQFDCEFLDLFEFLDTLGGGIKRARFAREKHQDGNTHIHVAVKFQRRIDKRGESAFAVFDFNGRHPNIQHKRSHREWDTAIDYCAKENDYLDFPQPDDQETESSNNNALGDPNFDTIQAANNAESWSSYLEECRLHGIPFGYASAQWMAAGGANSDITTENYLDKLAGRTIPSAILSDLQYEDDGRSWILQGASQTGKTAWALTNMPKPALWVTDIDDLKSFRAGFHVSIIFDEITFTHIPRPAQIAVVDRIDGRTIRCRHTNARVPAGIHKCFTCNDGFENFPVRTPDEAIDRRIKVINV